MNALSLSDHQMALVRKAAMGSCKVWRVCWPISRPIML
jgi:hypothetical protein